MVKIILTEEQFNMVRNHINEQVDSRFRDTLTPVLNYHNVTYKGFEIENITTPNIVVGFDIDLDIRSWGIQRSNINNIKGPKEIEAEISYYPNEDDTSEEIITIPIDWSKITYNKLEEYGSVGIDNNLEINLMNDNEGNILIKSIIISVNTF